MKLKSALIMLLSCIGIIQAQEMEMMFVGTYTDGGSKGVYSYRFNQETGEAVVLDSLEMTNPSYLTISRDQRLMYVVSETHDDKASLNIVRITENGGMRRLFIRTWIVLYYHDFERVSDAKSIKNPTVTTGHFWKKKSYHTFLWGDGEGDSNRYIGFLGYEMCRTGHMRLRRSNILRFKEKQVDFSTLCANINWIINIL